MTARISAAKVIFVPCPNHADQFTFHIIFISQSDIGQTAGTIQTAKNNKKQDETCSITAMDFVHADWRS